MRLSLEAADFALDDVVAEMEEEMDEGGSFLDGTLPLSLGSSDDGEWGRVQLRREVDVFNLLKC